MEVVGEAFLCYVHPSKRLCFALDESLLRYFREIEEPRSSPNYWREPPKVSVK